MRTTSYAIIAAIVFFTSACSNYTQLYQTKATTQGISSGELLFFENDTVKITYSFWQKNGTLAYSIYNKLNTPIYIDWKKSSFISNGVKEDYWVDETITHSNSYHVGTYSSGYSYYGLLGLSTGSATGTSRSVKPERVIFIAPHSNVVTAKFSLYPNPGSRLKANAKSGISAVPNSNKQIPIRHQEFTPNNSPLSFRNFLTMSTTENFLKETYIDNGFYVAQISEMKHADFMGPGKYDKTVGKTLYQMPFKGPSCFYVDVK